jgi:hypothetical protein
MTRPSTQVDGRIASLALAVIDLRAHFEAQLRAVARAEEAVVQCGTARDRAAFDVSAASLRGEVQVVSDNNRSIRAVIDQMDVDSRELVFPYKKRAPVRS